MGFKVTLKSPLGEAFVTECDPGTTLADVVARAASEKSITLASDVPVSYRGKAMDRCAVLVEQGVIDGGVLSTPLKKLSKAERKAQQEAQRTKKETGKNGGVSGGGRESASGTPITKKKLVTTSGDTGASGSAVDATEEPGTNNSETERVIPLFAHLSLRKSADTLTESFKVGRDEGVHPAFIRLGLQYAEGVVSGSTARCVAMMNAFREMILSYTAPEVGGLIIRDLESRLSPNILFMNQCRPYSVGMGNAIRVLKRSISKLRPDVTEREAKDVLVETIDTFIRQRIRLATDAIGDATVQKIKDGDVILTHASSFVVQKSLVLAHKSGKKFRVVVVDSRPRMEGKDVVRNLLNEGITCTYIQAGAISYVMNKEVTKVLVGAHTLFQNGYVMSRVGTAIVAMVAKNYNVPVIVLCETYKFAAHSQTDSIVHNELGSASALTENPHRKVHGVLEEWQTHPTLKLLNLTYDVTPPSLVDMVITEVGCLPVTSAPVVNREFNNSDIY